MKESTVRALGRLCAAKGRCLAVQSIFLLAKKIFVTVPTHPLSTSLQLINSFIKDLLK
jgi:hypothetical protein